MLDILEIARVRIMKIEMELRELERFIALSEKLTNAPN